MKSESFPVSERFVSINGEGAHAGKLAAFIRFSGCNLRCSYCDTVWAQDPASAVEFITKDEIVRWIADQPCTCVTITGGEPTLQPRLLDLVCGIGHLDGIEVIEIETNGSVDLESLTCKRPSKLRLTVDYKLPSSGMEEHMHLKNFDLLESDDVVKFVAGTQEDLETLTRVIQSYHLGERCKVYISPVFGKMNPAYMVDYMREQRLDRVTLQLQLHKIIWSDQEKGV